MRSRQYGRDVLAPGSPTTRTRGTAPVPEVLAEPGLVVEDIEGRFCGAVVRCDKDAVTLEDRHGRHRVFPLRPRAFMIDGQIVTLVRPKPGMSGSVDSWVSGGSGSGGSSPPGGNGGTGSPPMRRGGLGGIVPPGKTPSGSVAAPGPQRAKVARASRIYVEGRHDAELIERIWGDDLRDLGVVVEYLEGVDDLPAITAAFGPGPGRRLGVLVDHLVDGSKESKLAAEAASDHVLVVGHPYIDIWAAVRPEAVGIPAWPSVPPGQPWKEGVLRALGWPLDTAAAWQKILGSVRSYTDLRPELLGRVEELIDFVTAPGGE
jgi:hypothetical protein